MTENTYSKSESELSVFAEQQEQAFVAAAQYEATSSAQLVSPLPSKLGPNATEEEIQVFHALKTKRRRAQQAL